MPTPAAPPRSTLLGTSAAIFVIRLLPALATVAALVWLARRTSPAYYGQYQAFWVQWQVLHVVACLGLPTLVLTHPAAQLAGLLSGVRRRHLAGLLGWWGLLAGGFAAVQHGAGSPFAAWQAGAFLLLGVPVAVLDAYALLRRQFGPVAWLSGAYAAAFLAAHGLFVGGWVGSGGLLNALLLANGVRLGVLGWLARPAAPGAVGFGAWVLGVGCWILGFRCWVLGVRLSVLGVRQTNTENPTPNTENPTPKTQHRKPKTQHPIPNTQHHPGPGSEKSEVLGLWFHTALNEIVQVLFKWVDKLVLSFLLPAAGFALYFNGTIDVPFLPLLLGAAGSGLLLHFGEAHTADAARIGALRAAGALLGRLVGPLFFFLVFFRRELFGVVFAHRYDAAVPLFLVASLVVPLRAYNFTALLQHKGRGRTLSTGAVLDLLVALALMYPLYCGLGLAGVALAFVVSTYGQAAFYLAHTARLLAVPWPQLLPWRAWAAQFGGAALALGLLHGLLAQWLPEAAVLWVGAGLLALWLAGQVWAARRAGA